MMAPYMVTKTTSETYTGRETQQRNRAIKNTFQTVQLQARAELERSAAKAKQQQQPQAEGPEYPGGVGPKRQVNVPKPLVLYQLSKQLDASALEGGAGGPSAAPSRNGRPQ